MRGARSTQTQRIGDDVVELNNAHQRKGTKKPENQEEDVYVFSIINKEKTARKSTFMQKKH